ncbi:MAG: Nif3-like dinuclear metal center hexameric protein [Bacteroides sp.]|nr:Nif3-like dinuclear metal center hexameric protein [Bacteroides sp.]MCM1414116.1 Nif3-like dinuclear metal center hexameric protein [Bacteroides sp.]MCM1472380.1 Nif3-like dinuclear metal center hexameric protein [Bacteroides sp.]
MPLIKDITGALETIAPTTLQESYDNCGLIVGNPDDEARGVLLSVDVTPAVVEEAIGCGCNLIVAHHPVIFMGLKTIISGHSAVEQSIIMAIRHGISIYACHTSLDNAPGGVSHEMARMLGLRDVAILDPTPSGESGSGAVGRLPEPMSPIQLVEHVKKCFSSPVARCSDFPSEHMIETVALCGGSGSFLIPEAIRSGAQAMITSDTKYHDFVDFASRILIVDIGHHESENCTKQIFYRIIREKFPIFAVRYSQADTNPIKYL